MCVRISWLTFLLLGSLTGDRNMLQAARAALHTRQLAQQTVWTPDIQRFSTQKKPGHKKTRQLAQQTVWTPDLQRFSTQKKLGHKKPDS